VGILVAVVFIAVWMLRAPDEEAIIKTRLDKLAKAVSKDNTRLSKLQALANTRRALQYFTKNVVVKVGKPLPDIHGQDEIMIVVHRAMLHEGAVNVAFVDTQVALGQDPKQAQAYMTVKATGPGPAGERFMEVKEIEMTLVKQDDAWLIDKVILLKAFE